MAFLKNTKGSLISDYFKIQDDIGDFKSGTMCDLALYTDHLEIKAPFAKQTLNLRYDQIKEVFHGLKTEISVSNKSVIGRAVAGGVLFGGVGAVVGAISGAGTKNKKDTRLYLIISYVASTGDNMILKFEDTRKYKGKKLALKLRELAGVETIADKKNVNL